MLFAQALLEAINNTQCIRRSGWNGKGMHVYYEDQFTIPRGNGRARTYDPCFIMYTAHGTHQPGWLASQADMRANDWEIVPREEVY